MKRKTFIQLGASLALSRLVDPLESWAQAPRLRNWAGNITYSTSNVQYPKSLAEVQQVVKTHAKLNK